MRRAGLAGVALACALLASSAPAATIKPTVKTDDAANNGNCTLREAVEAASTNAAVDSCPKGQKKKLDRIPLKKGTYALLGANNDDDNETGDLDVDGGGPVQIAGRGLDKTTVDSPPADRAFHLFSGSSGSETIVKLGRLTLDGGEPNLWGGVIRAEEGIGGKLALDRVRVQNGELQFGGGIYTDSGKLTIRRSFFVGNNAEVSSTGFPGVHAIGGAIDLTGIATAKISDSGFFDNNAITNDSSAFGGAISLDSGADAIIRRSLFEENDAYSSSANAGSTRLGGAIWMGSVGDLQVVNSTFAFNKAIGSGAGARGGAFYGEAAGSTEFVNSTFLENAATSASAFLVNAGTLVLSRSAVQPPGPAAACGATGSGSFESDGYNVAPSTFGCALDAAGDRSADPLLGDTPNLHGGFTETVKLMKGSPAIDRIPAKKCKPAEGEDQRGYRRPAGNRCDSGAYERGAKPR